jgi:hypothetical protein
MLWELRCQGVQEHPGGPAKFLFGHCFALLLLLLPGALASSCWQGWCRVVTNLPMQRCLPHSCAGAAATDGSSASITYLCAEGLLAVLMMARRFWQVVCQLMQVVLNGLKGGANAMQGGSPPRLLLQLGRPGLDLLLC